MLKERDARLASEAIAKHERIVDVISYGKTEQYGDKSVSKTLDYAQNNQFLIAVC